MSLKDKLRGTTETIFEIGRGGPQLKNNSTVLEVVATDGTTLAKVRAADLVGSTDVVTLGYFNTNNAGAQDITVVKMPLVRSTKVSSVAIPNNAIILFCVLDVTTAYDNSATWAVKRTGDASTSPMATADNDPATIGTYKVDQVLTWGATSTGTVTATVTGSPTVGASVLYIGYVTPTDIS